MIIKNGLAYQEDKTFVKKDLYINDGKIVEGPEEVTDKTEVDATGLLVLPGLVDVHSHGAVGCDFSDGDMEGLGKILTYERAHGVTSYCPTSMTIDKEELRRIFKAMGSFTESGEMAHVAGINMEGPFLDVNKKGAHLAEHVMKPDVDFFRECNAASGNKIRLVTLAPNVEGLSLIHIWNSPWAARRLLSHSQLNLPGRPAGGEGEREGAPEERVMLEFGIFC